MNEKGLICLLELFDLNRMRMRRWKHDSVGYMNKIFLPRDILEFEMWGFFGFFFLHQLKVKILFSGL